MLCLIASVLLSMQVLQQGLQRGEWALAHRLPCLHGCLLAARAQVLQEHIRSLAWASQRL